MFVIFSSSHKFCNNLFLYNVLIYFRISYNSATTTDSFQHPQPPPKESLRYALVKDLSLRYKVQVGKRCIEQVEVSIFVDSPVGGGRDTLEVRQMNTWKQQKARGLMTNLGVAKSILYLINNAWEYERVTLMVP